MHQLTEFLHLLQFSFSQVHQIPPSNIAITGRYILCSEIFDELEKMKIGAGGEIQLTDAIRDCMLNQDVKVCGKIVESTRFDCGNPIGWLEANNFVMEQNKKEEVKK